MGRDDDGSALPCLTIPMTWHITALLRSHDEPALPLGTSLCSMQRKALT